MVRLFRAVAVVSCLTLVAAFVLVSPVAAATAPSQPRNLLGVAGPAAGYVSLSWTAPLKDNGSAITTYGYQKSTDGGLTWSSTAWFNSTALTQNSGTIPALGCTTRSNTKGCEFRVYAKNAIGVSVASNTTRTWIAPSVPNNFGGTINSTYTTAALKWQRPSVTGDFATITYHIQRNEDGAGFVDILTTTNLTANAACAGAKACSYKIYATNGQGASLISQPKLFTVSPGPVGAPAIMNTGGNRATGVSTIKTTWTAPTSGLAVDHYEVQTCAIVASATGGCNLYGWSTSTSVSTLSYTTTCSAGVATCYVRVRAVNTRGAGGPFTAANLTPWAPYDLSASPSAPGKFTSTLR